MIGAVVRTRPTTAVLAATALGAGAIHAAAAGAHAAHQPASLVFTGLALAQLGTGSLVLARRDDRRVIVSAWLVAAAALAGWTLAKTVGIPFVRGLDVVEPIRLADASAMVLATVSVVAGAVALRRTNDAAIDDTARVSGTFSMATAAALIATVVLAAAGTVGAGAYAPSHISHDAATTPGQRPQAVAPVPYDPTKPIDLGGVPGVTPQQQAAAENLVVLTLARLPQWADPTVAEAAGFRSIHDGATGVEHFVNEQFMTDDVVLNPDKPESLVYDTKGGGRRLVAAMYMLQRGLPLDQVPDIGGRLMQFHIHDNLCFNAEGHVAGLTKVDGNCTAGLLKPVPTPMIHVWIEPHRCGPFAALEGVGGGRIRAGDAVLCDHAHSA